MAVAPIRGHLAEFGVIGPNRPHNISLLATMIEDETDNRIPPVARHALSHLVEQLREVKAKLVRIDDDLADVAKRSEACRRLMTIPGQDRHRERPGRVDARSVRL